MPFSKALFPQHCRSAKPYFRNTAIQQSLISATLPFSKALFPQNCRSAKPYFRNTAVQQTLISAKLHFGKALFPQNCILAKHYFRKILLPQNIISAIFFRKTYFLQSSSVQYDIVFCSSNPLILKSIWSLLNEEPPKGSFFALKIHFGNVKMSCKVKLTRSIIYWNCILSYVEI